jgi:hypothetical protein
MTEQPAAAAYASLAGARRPTARVPGTALPLVIPLLLGVVVWLWFALSTRFTLEDAYITFRYARNVARGAGFVFNPGERVLGTTTPLQTLLLAAFGVVLGPERIPAIARLLMPCFGLAAAALAYLALIRFGLPSLGAAAGIAVFLLHPVATRTGLGGMETPLALFLMALGLYFLAREQAVAATAAAAMLVLCRPDGMIWGGMIAGAGLLASYRRPLRQAAVFSALTLPWAVFATVYFGSALPTSMLAKGVVRPGREHLLSDPVHFRRMAEWYVRGTGFARGDPMFCLWVALLALGLYAALRSRRREVLLIPAYPAIYAVLMYLGRAPKYEWYLAPMLFCSVLVGGMGVGVLALRVASRRAAWCIAGAVCTAMVTMVGAAHLARDLPAELRYNKLVQENEWELRRGVGIWLKENTRPSATVAMEAIGYQGYFSERRVIDTAGLVTPPVVRLKASTGSNGLLFRRIWTELRPDYFVLRSFEVDENHHFYGGKLFPTQADRAAFFRHYRELRRFTAPHPELAPKLWHLTVYERVG